MLLKNSSALWALLFLHHIVFLFIFWRLNASFSTRCRQRFYKLCETRYQKIEPCCRLTVLQKLAEESLSVNRTARQLALQGTEEGSLSVNRTVEGLLSVNRTAEGSLSVNRTAEGSLSVNRTAKRSLSVNRTAERSLSLNRTALQTALI